MNRDILINFIPKPTNSDVILYDTSLIGLIDVDVFEEYKKLLPIFNLSCQQFLGYKNNIEEYERTINQIYLYRNDWSEEDFLYYLQNEKKTYANLFGPIKRIESNIDVLQKKIKMTEDKINMQIAKEEQDLENKKNNIDKKIDDNTNKLLALKEICATLKIEKEKIKETISQNEKDFLFLKVMVENMEKGQCKCEYCGTLLSNISSNSDFYKRTYKKLENNKTELQKLLNKQQKNKEQLDMYEKNMKEIKQELQNDCNFRSEDFNFYRKKSVEVLKLEAKRDEMLNNVSELQKQLQRDSQTRSKQFLDLKDKISKYELSLENLRKIKEMKNKIEKERIEYNRLYKEISDMKIKIEQYKKFLTIFFKIYEQKAAEFCGKEYKFKIFEFDNYTLQETFKIYYKGVEFDYLTPKVKRIVEDTLTEKFLFFN